MFGRRVMLFKDGRNQAVRIPWEFEFPIHHAKGRLSTHHRASSA